MKSGVEADKLVDTMLSKLAKKSKVDKPLWMWTKILGTDAGYIIAKKIIVIDEWLRKYRYLDPKLADNVLRWIVAHEFAHYLIRERNMIMSKVMMEHLADHFAEQETGKPAERFYKELREYDAIHINESLREWHEIEKR